MTKLCRLYRVCRWCNRHSRLALSLALQETCSTDEGMILLHMSVQVRICVSVEVSWTS